MPGPKTSPNTQMVSNFGPKQKTTDKHTVGTTAVGTIVSLVFNDVTTAASATAGAGSALPATPAGYALIVVGGVEYKMPFYNV